MTTRLEKVQQLQDMLISRATGSDTSDEDYGKGKKAVKPSARHATLAVNLAGSMAAFLVAAWEERSSKSM